VGRGQLFYFLELYRRFYLTEQECRSGLDPPHQDGAAMASPAR
jgi:hypothetical protein